MECRWHEIHDFLYGWCLEEVLVEGTRTPITNEGQQFIIPSFIVKGRESRRIVGWQSQNWLGVDIFQKTDEELDAIYEQVEAYKMTLPLIPPVKFEKITIPKIIT